MEKIKQVKDYCTKRAIKLTPLREDVLALIYSAPQPIGAYELLRKLRKKRPNAEPPTVYRVLEFLLDQHLIHRVESLNAYVCCIQPEGPHQSQLLLCKHCGGAREVDDPLILEALAQCAETHGFVVENQLTEIRGTCTNCRESVAV